MRQYIAFICIGFGGLWFLVNFFSTLEAAHSYYARRGRIVKGVLSAFTSRWSGLLIFWAGLLFLYYTYYGIPRWLWNRDLEAQVLSCTYDSKSRELVTNVQYFNNGNARRTVLGLDVLLNHPPDVACFYISAKPETDIDPEYIEPGVPIVVTYHRFLSESEVPDIKKGGKAGSILTLDIRTLNSDGSKNATMIFALKLFQEPEDYPDKFQQEFLETKIVSLDGRLGTRFRPPSL